MGGPSFKSARDFGAAFHYSRANSIQATMQAAADTTALMKAQSAASLTSQNLQTQAGIYYQAMFTRTDAANPPEQALPAAAASQIVTTFNQIGSNLSKLHIAK